MKQPSTDFRYEICNLKKGYNFHVGYPLSIANDLKIIVEKDEHCVSVFGFSREQLEELDVYITNVLATLDQQEEDELISRQVEQFDNDNTT